MRFVVLLLVATLAQDFAAAEIPNPTCDPILLQFSRLGENCSNAYFDTTPKKACSGPCEDLMKFMRARRSDVQSCLDARSDAQEDAHDAVRIRATLVTTTRFLNAMCSKNERGDYCAPLETDAAPYTMSVQDMTVPQCPRDQRDVNSARNLMGCCAGSWYALVRLLRGVDGTSCGDLDFGYPCKAPRWDGSITNNGNANGNGNGDKSTALGVGAGAGGLAAVGLGITLRRKRLERGPRSLPISQSIAV